MQILMNELSLSAEELNEIEVRLKTDAVVADDVRRLIFTVRQSRTAKETGRKNESPMIIDAGPQAEMNNGSSVEIFTDGACSGNPGPGGWGAIVVIGDRVQEISGGISNTTNNRMELIAAIEGLKLLNTPAQVTLTTDSKYVKDGITKWIKTWKRNGWKSASKEPVKNRDLWTELDELVQMHSMDWRWVRGHAGHPENERCDILAREAIGKLLEKPTR